MNTFRFALHAAAFLESETEQAADISRKEKKQVSPLFRNTCVKGEHVS